MPRPLPLQPSLGPPEIGWRPHTAPSSATHTSRRGSELPWRRAHTGRQLTWQQVEPLIRSRAEDLKPAFMALDPDGTGLLSREEFTRVLEGLLPVCRKQLHAVINQVCAGGAEKVDYLQFLRGFSRAPEACRAWSRCSSSGAARSGARNSPITLSEIQKLLKEKIGGNLKNVVRAFRLFDYNHGGCIQRHDLRRILDNYSIRLTDREFQRLWIHYSPNNSSTISYELFLQTLGFGDSHNFLISPVCTKLDVCSRGKSPHHQVKQQKQTPGGPSVLPLRKLQTQFHDEMCVNSASVWQALQALDATRSGLVTQEVLRAVLSGFTFPMNLHSFQKLASRYGVRETGPLRWKHFMGHFMSSVKEEEDAEDTNVHNHGVSQQTAHQEDTLPFQDLYPELKEVFLLLEEREAVPVTPADLRRFLESRAHGFKTRLPRWQITELLNVLDPEHTGIIRLADLHRLHPSDTTPPANHAAETRDVPKETQYTDHSGNVTQEDLKTALSSSGMNISDSQLNNPRRPRRPRASLDAVFQKMRWRFERGESRLSDRVWSVCSSSGGTLSEGDVRKILEDSSVTLEDQEFNKFTDQLGFRDGRIESSTFLQKCEEAAVGRRQPSSEGQDEVDLLLTTARLCLAAMKTRIKTVHGDNLTAFHLMDRRRRGVVDRHDFKKLCDSLGFLCREHEHERLLDLIGLRPGGNLNYAEFVDVVENNGKRKQEARSASVQRRLHELLSSEARYRWTDMSKILCQPDSDGQSWIHKNSLRRLLFTYSLPLTSEEFDRLWLRYDPEQRGRVAICDFLEKLGFHHELDLRTGQKLNRTAAQQDQERPETSEDSSLKHAELKVSREDDFLSAFDHKPEKKSDALRQVDCLVKRMQELAVASAPDLFKSQCVWSETPLQHSVAFHPEGRASNILRVPPASPGPRGPDPAGAALQRTQSAPQFSSRRPPSAGRPGTGSPAGGVERRLRVAVQRCWKEMERSCREEDPEREGLISTPCFLKILRSLSVPMTQTQFELLAGKYDIMTKGCVSYHRFLRHFLLNLNPAETRTPFQRCRLPQPTQTSRGVLSRSCVDVMLRIYDVICSSWTSIRRGFLASDGARTGSVSVQDFRKVLRHFGVNLSEEEFFHLSSFFDADTTGTIRYDHFLWTFLR